MGKWINGKDPMHREIKMTLPNQMMNNSGLRFSLVPSENVYVVITKQLM